jgi:hypothetical protein
MARTPSLPAHKTKPSASAKRRSKRSSGLFESSSESGSESSHEPSPTDPVRGKKEARRRETAVSNATAAAPPTRSRHHSLGASPVMVAAMPSRENSVNNERKGLFEIDDDTADSVETLRERVKLRQKKKEHEVQSLKSELEAALARVSELDDALARERREKDEFAIRMDECQRIIEKRNKQLIKASERLARITEQSESDVIGLQQQLEAMKVEVERMKAAERAALERQRSEYEDKLAHERVRWEAQVESVTLEAAEKLRVKDAEEAYLQRRIAQLEADVVGATSRIAESSEYQILLKRCDDAEAISRGLRFQLEKAQHEKKYLKKQLAAATAPTTAPASSNAFLPPTDLFADVSSTHTERGNHSPTSSIASADLASFDFSRVEISPPMSPIAASPPTPSLKTAADPEAQRSDDPSQGDTSSKDGRFETLFGGGKNDTGENSDDGPPSATASQTESKARPGSGTINFFEKISIKFKRTASSPRNSAPAPPGGKSVGDETSSQSASPAFTVDLPPTNRRKVLSKRPKMYVAKSPSDYEESSDSIFGSDSDSDESSDEDDDDQPPPPPPKEFGSRSPTGSVETPSVGATALPPPPPPLFGDVSDNDGDSSSDDDVRPPSRSGDLRRVILPTPASSPPPGPKEPIQSQPDHHKTARAKVPSSSGDSDSDLSDSSDDEEKHKKPPSPAKSPTVRVDTTKTKAQAKAVVSSSDSEQEVPVRMEETRRRRVSIDDTNVHEASANQPKTKRERSRSTEGDASAAAAAKVNRMNEYMEARARKRQEKLSKKEEKEIAEHKKREEYEKEWERMAEEERERRRKQQKARRTGKRRPSSMKTVRVSQMRNHMNKQQKDVQGDGGLGQTKAEGSDEDNGPPQPDAQRRGHQSSGSDASEDESGRQQQPSTSEASSPPLPPEPTAVNTDLYLRQQARLREHHEMEMKKKQDSAEADQVRGQIHRRVELWAYAKELHHMILTLDQISSNEALRQCQLMVVQSPDPETLRKAYRYVVAL